MHVESCTILVQINLMHIQTTRSCFAFNTFTKSGINLYKYLSINQFKLLLMMNNETRELLIRSVK